MRHLKKSLHTTIQLPQSPKHIKTRTNTKIINSCESFIVIKSHSTECNMDQYCPNPACDYIEQDVVELEDDEEME
jgi:hypothetical protein